MTQRRSLREGPSLGLDVTHRSFTEIDRPKTGGQRFEIEAMDQERSQMPARKIPRYGAQKNIGKFFSVKTGRVAWYEALTERDYMYLLDFDRDVTFWWEQPLQMRYSHDGKTHRYTPDLEVHRTSKKQIVEVKPKDKVESGERDFLFRTAAAICDPEGYEFIVVTDEQIRQQPKLTNVKKF